MIMMVVIVLVVVPQAEQLVVEQLVVEVLIVQIVNLIGLLMDLSVVILHGMSMVSIVQRWNLIMVGIVQVVHVLAIQAVEQQAEQQVAVNVQLVL